ncbi:MAG: hypothetical protein AABZ23_04195 [Deltaproteobacteria bacterium]
MRRVMLFVLLVFVSGCAGKTILYINKDANFSYIQKVAVLPFNNLSDDRFAGERVKNALIVELMSRQAFDVMEQGEVSKVLNVVFRDIGIEEGKAVEVDKETLKLIGERLGVQAVILGSVDEYTGKSSGRMNVVALSIRMIDANSGIVLWQARAASSGGSVWRKMVGIDDIDISELTPMAVKKALDTLL